MSSTLQAEIPRALLPLLNHARYKGAHGGRGGGKSHFFAEHLILTAFRKKTRAVCIREVQNSIKESVRQLLVDKIQKFGLGQSFEVLESEIRGPHGSLIIFRGMQAYNAENIKSLEDYDVAWVEEAQTLSAISLRLLRPTIRKEGSEIWFSWNPRHDTDPVDEFLRGKVPHPESIVVEVNYNQNPWFPSVLHKEMEHDRSSNPEMAVHVWDGGYQIVTEGAYYAQLIADAEKEGRIGDYGFNPKLKVKTAWDIGVDDYTAVWFLQEYPGAVNVIDYFEYSGEGAEGIVKDCMPELHPDPRFAQEQLKQIDRAEQFRYERHYFPHDVSVREWGGGARTRQQTLNGLGVRPIQVGVAQGPAERINASRKLLPFVRFNKSERVLLGLSRLRRYSRKFNNTMQTYTTPLHDENSHGSDAFGEYAVNSRLIHVPTPKETAQKDGYRTKRRKMSEGSSNWKTA